ncbi:MAG: hypothetical protein Q4C34_06905 [Bacteroidales bacterium]|nr:hypothetical protein [Bacteroidales bacterium]
MSRMLAYIFAMLLCVLAAGGSVMQYHHHDPDGRICMCGDVGHHAKHPDNHDHNRPGHCEVRANQPMLAESGTRHVSVPDVPLTAVLSQLCLLPDDVATDVPDAVFRTDVPGSYAPPGLQGLSRRGPPVYSLCEI